MRSRLGISLSFVVVAALALSGCSEDPSDAIDGEQTGETSGPGEDVTLPAPTGGLSDPPTASSTSTVQPATGDLLELSNVSVRAPEGFKADPPDMTYLRFAFERGVGVGSVVLANTPSLNDSLSPRDQARISIRNGVYDQEPSILEPVEIGGLTLYHYAGQVDESEYVEEFGVVYDGSLVSVKFVVALSTPEAERQALVDSVMATLTFS